MTNDLIAKAAIDRRMAEIITPVIEDMGFELVALSADAVRAEALREHLVDVADLTHAADLGDVSGITMLPEEHFMTTAVDHCVCVPRQVGSRWPLDNLRAAERWWMA